MSNIVLTPAQLFDGSFRGYWLEVSDPTVTRREALLDYVAQRYGVARSKVTLKGAKQVAVRREDGRVISYELSATQQNWLRGPNKPALPTAPVVIVTTAAEAAAAEESGIDWDRIVIPTAEYSGVSVMDELEAALPALLADVQAEAAAAAVPARRRKVATA